MLNLATIDTNLQIELLNTIHNLAIFKGFSLRHIWVILATNISQERQSILDFRGVEHISGRPH